MKNISVEIYKEKKEKDFRMVILPMGMNEIGLFKVKDYGLVVYLNKNETTKIGEFIFWALNESDREIIKNESKVEFVKKFFNYSSFSKVLQNYNSIDLDFEKGKYALGLNKKEKGYYIPFKDEYGNYVEYEFKEKPTPNELGAKVMEMFEYKEKYDEQ